MKLFKPAIGATAVALMALSAGAATADESAEEGKQPAIVENEVEQKVEAPGPSGLTIVRDAETGKLRAPTAEEWRSMASTFDPLNRSDAGLVERHHPDGRVSVVLQGRFQSMTVVRREPTTGKIDPVCTHDAETAGQILNGASAEEISDEK